MTPDESKEAAEAAVLGMTVEEWRRERAMAAWMNDVAATPTPPDAAPPPTNLLNSRATGALPPSDATSDVATSAYGEFTPITVGGSTNALGIIMTKTAPEAQSSLATPPRANDAERERIATKLDGHAIRYAMDYGYNIATDLMEAAAALRVILATRPSPAPVEAWQPISTVPLQTDGVDLWCENIAHGDDSEARFADMFINDQGKWEDWHGYLLEPKWKPTHWMPLPAPPIHRDDRGEPNG
jgi:hypothetical protein